MDPYVKTGRKPAEKNRFYDFSDFAFLRSDFGSLLGVETSNRPNKVRVFQNCENHVFEITRFIWIWSVKESFLILRKMFRCHLGVKNRFFRTPILALSVILNGNEKVPCKDWP